MTLDLDPATLAALRQIAAAESRSLGAVVNDAIRRDLCRRTRAKTAAKPDERLIAPPVLAPRS